VRLRSRQQLRSRNARSRGSPCRGRSPRCPFVRNCHCRPSQRGLVSAALREIFNAEDGGQARARVGEVIARLGATVPKLAAPLEEAEEDLLAFYAFSAAH